MHHTLTVFFAASSKAFPCETKILALAFRRSFLSIPSFRGMAPTNMATSILENATFGSAVEIISNK